MRRARRAALLCLCLAAGSPGAARPAAQGELPPPRRISVSIVEPVDNDFVFGKSRIAAQVEASREIRGIRVEFWVGGRLIFIDREAPFEAFHDFGEEPRSFVVEAVATGSDGETARATIVTRKLAISYREQVDRVLVTASVTDDDRRFVSGLTRDDFRVLEDDVPQTIIDFAQETRPITLAILIDTSGSMREEIDMVQGAAVSFVETLRPEDRALVIDFDENVYLLQELTNDHDLLRAAIEGTDAEGGTAFYDAMFAAYRRLKKIVGRKAIVLLTDGADTNSRFSFQRIVEWTRTNDVSVYSIGLGATVLDVGVRGSLKQIAEDTGGRSYFPGSGGGLEEIYRQIATDLRSQYYLTYASTNLASDGSWRKIRVETTSKGARVKARKGYYAVKR